MTPEKSDFSSDVTAAIMQKKSINRKIANILLQGLPGSGKTSLLDRLLNKPFRAFYSSTGISEKIVLVEIDPSSTHTTVHACEDNKWKVTDFKESMVSQLDSCKGFIPNSVREEVLQHSMPEKHPQLDTNELASDIECHVREVLAKHNVNNIADLQRKSSIYIRDTGGQVEFQESLSLLIFGPSIFIFVLKTNIDIHDKIKIQYRLTNREIINQYESTISTMDALIQFLTSVSAIHTTEEGVFQVDGTSVCHKPIVFIVGTHIDKLGLEPQSKLKSINNALFNMIHEKKFNHLIHFPNSLVKVMYEVDNTSQDDSSFQSLRSDINQYIKDRDKFLVNFRVSFLLFSLELNNIKQTVLSMDECKRLAAKFNIEDKEIDSLLHFLHFRVGIIQHYNVQGISKIIIKEPDVLFKKVTELILKTFLSSGSIPLSQQESFCKKGILDICTFESLLSKEDQITPEQFLLFLLHLRIAVPFTDRSGLKKYFIPLILNHVPKSPPSERVYSDIAPLAITFQLGHCPKGLFGMLISYLLNPERNQELTFDLLEDRIYQDQISLQVSSTEDVDQICLRSFISHLEVSVTLENPSNNSAMYAPRATTPNEVCNNIRVTLDNCIELSLKKLHYSCDKVGAAFSLTCPQECGLLHEVKKGKHSLYMRCRKHGKLIVPASGCLWFKEGK